MKVDAQRKESLRHSEVQMGLGYHMQIVTFVQIYRYKCHLDMGDPTNQTCNSDMQSVD